MKQFRKKVPIAMDVGSGIGTPIPIEWVAHSARGATTKMSSTLDKAPACSAIPENDADQGAPHLLRRF